MKRFSEFLAERKNKSKSERILELQRVFKSTPEVSEEEKERLVKRYLSQHASIKEAVEVMASLKLSQEYAKVMDEIHNDVLARAAVAMELNASPASERLVRGVARSVIRDHHEELERLAYK
ncbi:hypothetical protein ACT9VR_001412 [Acinetobacter baumannii]|nr:hypothetical protein [Acinetobacter baumannii]EKV5176784.1 hypothetical protein [Acinetobacter baumannii]EKV8209102.1 hypothetical protein [Acinetobacter baumannii]EKW0397330.1 hypothetical protein [Acinetobacter baumannii]EKW0574132.1 hypothetical protein [Acinetobacter baumannii]